MCRPCHMHVSVVPRAFVRCLKWAVATATDRPTVRPASTICDLQLRGAARSANVRWNFISSTFGHFARGRRLWFALCHASPDFRAFFAALSSCVVRPSMCVNLAESNESPQPSVPSIGGWIGCRARAPKYSYALQSPLAGEEGWFGSLLPLEGGRVVVAHPKRWQRCLQKVENFLMENISITTLLFTCSCLFPFR